MVRDTIWSRTRIVGRTPVNVHPAEDQHVGEWRDTRAPPGLTEPTGRRWLARVPLSWADVDIDHIDTNMDFKQCCWPASGSLFSSDGCFGLLDRMVRRYHGYESIARYIPC